MQFDGRRCHRLNVRWCRIIFRSTISIIMILGRYYHVVDVLPTIRVAARCQYPIFEAYVTTTTTTTRAPIRRFRYSRRSLYFHDNNRFSICSPLRTSDKTYTAVLGGNKRIVIPLLSSHTLRSQSTLSSYADDYIDSDQIITHDNTTTIIEDANIFNDDGIIHASADVDGSVTIEQQMEDIRQQIIQLNFGQWINCNSHKQVAIAIFGDKAAGSKSCDDNHSYSTNQRYLQRMIQQQEDTDNSSSRILDGRQLKLASYIVQYRNLSRRLKNSNEQQQQQQQNQQPEGRDDHLISINSTTCNDRILTTTTADVPTIVASSCRTPSHDVNSAKEQSNIQLDTSTSTVNDGESNSWNAYQKYVHKMFQNNSKNQINICWKEILLQQITRPAAQLLVYQLDGTICPMGYNPDFSASSYSHYRNIVQQRSYDDTDTDTDSSSSNSKATTVTTGTPAQSQAGKKGSFLAFCREQKMKYPDCILLVRCGDFYETFGIDAILLVEHCGLNAMANKARAGCPIRNIQPTIDDLIVHGYKVAVYEEGIDTGASTGGGSKSRGIKSRFLAQIVSSASPTYMYDLVLSDNNVADLGPASRPYVGVLSTQSGYTYVHIDFEERTVRVSERLTSEAVACRIATCPPTDPLLYVPSPKEYETYKSSSSAAISTLSLPFLPSRRDVQLCGPGGRIQTHLISPTLAAQQFDGQSITSEAERAKNVIVGALLELTEFKIDDDTTSTSAAQNTRRATVADYTIITADDLSEGTRTNALYLETAKQLGLMNDGAIPSLLPYLLHNSAPIATKRFLRRWLLTPPPPHVTQAMSSLITMLMDAVNSPPLPPLTVPSLGKVLAMIRAGQAGAQIYGNLLQTLHATLLVLNVLQEVPTLSKSNNEPISSFLTLLQYESGMAADVKSLQMRCAQAMTAIESVLSPIYHVGVGRDASVDDERISDCSPLVPPAFLERNEATWRGRVRKGSAPDAYHRVQIAAEQLSRAVDQDFGEESKNLIVQDVFNNIFALKDKPTKVKSDVKFIHPKDRFGKVLGNRYTTETVQAAVSDYVNACDKATLDVTKALVSLSQTLHDDGHIPAVVQASHANLILSTAFHHAMKATSLGWNMAETVEYDPTIDSAGHFNGVWPYWMERSEAVKNTFDLNGMWVLTAPNMSGKSTVMRSTAAAALLSVCGLCAPLLEGSQIRRFDHIFVRGASADIPSEQKSAFGAEICDVALLLRCCTEKSLIFVDELGRGTSPRDGTRLSGAVLESMVAAGMRGIFCTHLFDILKLPLQSMNRITNKRMAIHRESFTNGEYSWTYRLEDGVCTDSLALITAKQFGLPNHILQRAEAFSEYLPSSYLDCKHNEEPEQITHSCPIGEQSDVLQLLEKQTGQRVLEVAPGWSVPAAFDGKSVVYVLKLDTQPTRYYVGESDNIRTRIVAHRRKGDIRGYNKAVAFLALAPLGKSQARVWENQIIRKMATAGFILDSITDGRTIRNMRFDGPFQE